MIPSHYFMRLFSGIHQLCTKKIKLRRQVTENFRINLQQNTRVNLSSCSAAVFIFCTANGKFGDDVEPRLCNEQHQEEKMLNVNIDPKTGNILVVFGDDD